MRILFGTLIIMSILFSMSFAISAGWEMGFQFAVMGKVLG